MPDARDWSDMMQQHARLLEERTGQSLAEWNARVVKSGVANEAELRTWLDGQGVTGHPKNLLVMERFGYPEFLLASSDELLDGQYADRPALRPVLDAILLVMAEFEGSAVQARKTKASLMTPRRKFAEVMPTTKTRVDLFFRIDGEAPAGRLAAVAPKTGEVMNLKVGLTAADEVDDEIAAALGRAFEANC